MYAMRESSCMQDEDTSPPSPITLHDELNRVFGERSIHDISGGEQGNGELKGEPVCIQDENTLESWDMLRPRLMSEHDFWGGT